MTVFRKAHFACPRKAQNGAFVDGDKAAGFRRDLIKDGFQMMQFSVYIRHCASGENALVHIARVEAMVPPEGIVTVLKVTDRQFSDTQTFVGEKTVPPPSAPIQLELF